MAERAYNRICATIQITGENCDPIRPRRQPALLSTDFIDNSVGRNMPSLDVLYQPTPRKATLQEQNKYFARGLELLAEKIEPTLLYRPRTTSEKGSASIESKNNENITMELGACSNQSTIGELQTSFGKLFRIGTMGDVTWITEIPCPTQEVRRTIESHESMSQESKYCNGRVFMWEDMMQVLWPIGDSLEEVKLNHGKDKLFWVVEDDVIVYEFEPPSEHVYTTTEKGKNKKFKKKKHQKRH
ncbi:6636_t:CDS:2 [Ambispora leptoticha]|uniref:6636_t:CDS:1 n=1 Tax=Ambispora leptoticha TaxID=144679 RepID=A0A9N9ALJ4_9GLOM|nr:6636_t:CDS:2 [Ambispora leptoticha]